MPRMNPGYKSTKFTPSTEKAFGREVSARSDVNRNPLQELIESIESVAKNDPEAKVEYLKSPTRTLKVAIYPSKPNSGRSA